MKYTGDNRYSRNVAVIELAVILQDDKGIRFLAYAYPLGDGDWTYRDNYSEKVLLYCIEQEAHEMNNKEECEDAFRSGEIRN